MHGEAHENPTYLRCMTPVKEMLQKMTVHTSESRLKTDFFFPKMIDRANNIVIKRGRSDLFPLMRLQSHYKQEPFLFLIQIRGTNALVKKRNQASSYYLKCVLTFSGCHIYVGFECFSLTSVQLAPKSVPKARLGDVITFPFLCSLVLAPY